jgi:hypothetical protein
VYYACVARRLGQENPEQRTWALPITTHTERQGRLVRSSKQNQSVKRMR